MKHAHHSFDIDHEGRDSFRHRKAGASEVAVVSRHRWAIIHELRDEAEPPLDEILAKLAPCDLVIVEGYKRDSHDKIEVRNLDLDHPRLAGDDPTVVAIAANGAVADAPVPVFEPRRCHRAGNFHRAPHGARMTPETVVSFWEAAGACALVHQGCRLRRRPGGALR